MTLDKQNEQVFDQQNDYTSGEQFEKYLANEDLTIKR